MVRLTFRISSCHRTRAWGGNGACSSGSQLLEAPQLTWPGGNLGTLQFLIFPSSAQRKLGVSSTPSLSAEEAPEKSARSAMWEKHPHTQELD